MKTRARCFQTLLVLSLALGAQRANAEPSAAELSSARQAFESAVALEAEQKWAEASTRLRQAVAIKDTPGLRFHLAHCEEQQGALLEAALDYERARQLLGQGAKAPDVERLLGSASAELQRRIPHVVVEIPTQIQNPRAELDGKPYPPSELALGAAQNPGPHQLKVSAPGRSPFERAFSLREGEQRSIRVEFANSSPFPGAPASVTAPATSGTAAEAAAAPQPDWQKPGASPSRGRSPKLYWLLGESALTVTGLALGIGYSLAESSAGDRVQAAQGRVNEAAPGNATACATPGPLVSGPCSALHDAITDHNRDQLLSTVGFVSAGVGVAALVTTWLVYPSQRPESSGVQPLIALGRVGLQGRF